MSRNRRLHPVPRGGIDPIRSADDALAVLALAAPYGHDTIAIALDADRCGSSVVIVADTVDPDALFPVISTFTTAATSESTIRALIVASSRPDGDVEVDDVHRWLEASDLCRAGGLELIEWFVLGRSGPRCPREMIGEPAKWAQ